MQQINYCNLVKSILFK